MALAVVLLAGSALLLRSLLYSQPIHPGFDVTKPSSCWRWPLRRFTGTVKPKPRRSIPRWRRAARVPRVVRVSYARPPLTSDEAGETRGVTIPGVEPPRGSDRFKIRFNTVGPRFFTRMGARMVSGREFNEFDLPSKPPVVIVNDAMARRFWRDGDAVGRSIHISKKDYQIVGVVETGVRQPL